MRKLKKLSTFFKSWNLDVFKKDQNQIDKISKEIFEIDNKEKQLLISKCDIQQRLALKSNLLNINLNEARKWSQLCRLKWLSEGDENIAFFHKVYMARRHWNFIYEIQNS